MLCLSGFELYSRWVPLASVDLVSPLNLFTPRIEIPTLSYN